VLLGVMVGVWVGVKLPVKVSVKLEVPVGVSKGGTGVLVATCGGVVGETVKSREQPGAKAQRRARDTGIPSQGRVVRKRISIHSVISSSNTPSRRSKRDLIQGRKARYLSVERLKSGIFMVWRD